ncbi:hypothetical protein [Paenibacillus sp. 2TAB19]|uniref:hypothetical protein n=1 Tax=Paenibacillus sp. 2TAB19 TaxID=3233003 RepID=UPI003F95E9C9
MAKQATQANQANQATQAIPSHLLKDRYWSPLLYLFTENPKLRQHANHIDLEEMSVNSFALLTASGPWSPSEKFMLYLALHLFNEEFAADKLHLSDMDRLDLKNKNLALKALQLRFA